jgi:hypothetical protein
VLAKDYTLPPIRINFCNKLKDLVKFCLTLIGLNTFLSMLSGVFPRIAKQHLAKALAICISLSFLSSLALSSENTPLYDGRLVWAKRNADKLYILSSKKSTPDVLLDIPKAFGISKKIPTTISLAAIGESIFWLDYDYAYSKKKDLTISFMIYKADVDTGHVSTEVTLSQDSTRDIRQWIPTTLAADKTHLYFLGENINRNLILYSYSPSSRKLSVVYEFQPGTPIPKRLTTDGSSLYMFVEGAEKNQYGGIQRLSQFLLRLKLNDSTFTYNNLLPTLKSWTGASVLSIQKENSITTNGEFLFFTINAVPNNGHAIIRTDLDGNNQLMISGPIRETYVSSLTSSKESIFWSLEFANRSNYIKIYKIFRSKLDGTDSKVLAEFPTSNAYTDDITTMVFVDKYKLLPPEFAPVILSIIAIIAIIAIFVLIRLLPKKESLRQVD